MKNRSKYPLDNIVNPKDKHKDIKIIKGSKEGRRLLKTIEITSFDILTILNILKKENIVVNKTRKRVK